MDEHKQLNLNKNSHCVCQYPQRFEDSLEEFRFMLMEELAERLPVNNPLFDTDKQKWRVETLNMIVVCTELLEAERHGRHV